MLGVRIVGFKTLYASRLVEEGLSWRECKFVEPRERVHVVVAEDALPLEKLHIRLGVDLRYNLVVIVEVFQAGLGKRGCELLEGGS